MLVRVTLTGLLALTIAGCGGTDRKEWVDAYCYYGARTEPQLDGCRSHVTLRQVERSSRPAAVCAREGGEACDGAGRYWEDFLTIRDLSKPELEP